MIDLDYYDGLQLEAEERMDRGETAQDEEEEEVPAAPNPHLIGSTDAAAILGLSKWAGPLDVYRRIVDGYRRPQTEAMRRGLELEGAVAQAWAALNSRPIRRLRSMDRPKRREWQRVSFDYITTDEPAEIVEIKTTAHADGWGEGEDEIPAQYLIQCQVQLEVLDLDVAHIPVLVHGRGLDLRHHIRADREMQGLILEACERFWKEHVIPCRPPEWTASVEADEYVRGRWPRDTAGLRKATAEEAAIVRLLAERKAKLKALEAETEALELKVKAAIAEAQGLVDEASKPLVTFKSTKEIERTDWQAVAAEMRTMLELRGQGCSDVIQKYTARTAGSRRLLLKLKGVA